MLSGGPFGMARGRVPSPGVLPRVRSCRADGGRRIVARRTERHSLRTLDPSERGKVPDLATRTPAIVGGGGGETIPDTINPRNHPSVIAGQLQADAERRGTLPVAAPEVVLQTQDFPNARHGQPLLSQRLPPLLRRPSRGWQEASLPKAGHRRYSITPPWTACVGIRTFRLRPRLTRLGLVQSDRWE